MDATASLHHTCTCTCRLLGTHKNTCIHSSESTNNSMQQTHISAVVLQTTTSHQLVQNGGVLVSHSEDGASDEGEVALLLRGGMVPCKGKCVCKRDARH